MSHCKRACKTEQGLPSGGRGIIASIYAPAPGIITTSTLYSANNLESSSVF